MNVLFLTKKIPFPATDGESIVIKRDIELIHELGYKIHLISLNTKKHYINPERLSIPNYLIDFHSFFINTNSVLTLFFSLFSKFPFQLARFFNADIENKIKEYLSKNDIDIVIYQGLPLSLYKLDSPKISHHIYRSHNIEHKIWKQIADKKSNFFEKIGCKIISKSLKNYEDLKLKNFQYIISLSELEKSYYDCLYPTNSYSIPISLDVSFRTEYNVKTSGILFVGSLDWSPNIEGLDWFLSEIYPSISEIPLTIAGKGFYSPSKFKNVSVISNFDNIEDLFSTHKLLIVPLLSGSGIRIKILEGLAYGIPIISTAVGAEGIQIEENSLYISNTKEAWISFIHSAYTDDSRLNLMNKTAKSSFSKYYNSTEISAKWKSVLED